MKTTEELIQQYLKENIYKKIPFKLIGFSYEDIGYIKVNIIEEEKENEQYILLLDYITWILNKTLT